MMDKNLAVLFGVTLIGIIGVAILSPAFPEIKEGLGISDFEVAMLVTAFTLPGVFLAPLMGILADRFGRKKVLVPSLLLFGFAGTACAFVDFKLMLVLRFLQGIGGSALTSLAVTLIGDLYEGLRRARILGYNASVLSLGLASYPVIGGALAELNWRYPFFMFALAIPVGIGALRIRYPEIKQDNSLGEYIKDSLRLLVNRRIIVGFLSGCAVFVITYGAFMIYVPFLLESRFNASPSLRGLIQSSTLLFTALVASRLDEFIKAFGDKGTIKIGFLSYAVSLALIPFASKLYLFVVAMMFFGLGHGTVLPALQNLVVSIAPTENRGAVTTAYGSMIRIGQTLGPIFASAIAIYSIEGVFLCSSMLAVAFMILNQLIDC